MTFCSIVSLLAVVPFWTAHEVSFSNGAQFPGAKGAIAVAGDELRLDYDFSGGGHYVAAECALGERPSGGVSFRADVPDDVWLSVRFADSDGQTFVKNLRGGTDGLEPFEVRFDGKGPRWAHWGGKNDGVVRPPVVSLAFGAENRMKPLKGGGRGTVRLADVRLSAGGPEPAAAFDENLYASVAKAVGRLEERYGKSAAKGAKTRAVVAVANDFLGWIRDDLAHGRTDRAARETKELERLLRAEAKRLAAVASGEERDFPRTAGGFRLGFGHFEQVISEMERLEPLGQDIVQVEFGPAQVFPSEGTVSTNGLSRFFRAAEKAQRLGMKVCLLLSPHYFPQWALEKCPELKPCGDGMLHYCVHHPFARDLLKRYFELVVPLVKDHPALHSLCLSNEPVMSAWDDRCALQPRWTAWLRGRYADVAAMNAKWGTSYAAFEDCRLPRNFYAFGPSSPQALEMTRFNREAFAEFHAWMAGIVRGLAPGVPLHSKIMIHANFTEGTSFHCVDPELFATWSDLGGNDCMDYVTPGNPTWAHDFGPMEAGYDYLRSVSRAPVFNSENHIIDDGETREIPAGHVYSSLWQNMIHGQEGTTIWYWERAFSRGAMCEGLFLDRPTALAATAFAALDLNRLSKQVKAIAARKPTVLLHWSLSSLVLDKRDGAAFLHAYRAASCLGQPLGVATERMLAAYAADGIRRGALEDVRAVILPDSSHLPDKVRAGLAKLAAEGVPVVVCGRRPSLSDFNEPRDGDQFGFLGKFGERDLADRFFARAKDWKLPDYPRAVAADGGAPFGVESNGVVLDGVRHLSLVNHRNVPVRIRLPAAGTDLITGAAVSREIELEPLRPMLVAAEGAAGASARRMEPLAKGGVFTVLEKPVVALSGGTDGVSWRLLDWARRELRSGDWPKDGRLVLEGLPQGYYHVSATCGDGRLRDATFCIVPDPKTRTYPGDSFYGVDAALSWVSSPENYAVNWYGDNSYRACLDLIRLSGLPNVRERLSWSEVSQRPGEYRWGRYLENAKFAAARGLVLSGVFHDAPKYAKRNGKGPVDPAAVYRFCRDLGKTFGNAMGDWEFWNEPDISFWPDPAWDFMSAMKAAYLGFKAGNPGVTVLNGAPAYLDKGVMAEQMLANDLVRYSDVLNAHSYGHPTSLKGFFAGIRAFKARAGIPDRQVWFTESSTNVEGESRDEGLTPGFRAHSHAQELVLAELYAKNSICLQMEGLAKNYFFVFGAYNERGGRKDWGVQRRDGSVKPVYSAISTMTEHLVAAKLEGEKSVGEGVKCYVFRQPDGRQSLVYWSVSPIDAAKGELIDVTDRQMENCDRAFTLPAADGTYPSANWCGTKGEVVARDGKAELVASRYASYVDGLAGVTVDRPARPVGRIGNAAPAADEDLSIVMGIDFDRRVFRISKSEAGLDGDRGKVTLRLWNFSGEEKRGRIRWRGAEIDGLPPDVTLPADGKEVALDAVLRITDWSNAVSRVEIDGTFGGRRTSRLVVPVRSDKMMLETCEVVPLDANDVKFWERNDSATETRITWDEQEKAVRFDMEWTDPKTDRWFYPQHRFRNRAESFDNATHLDFEARMVSNKMENDVLVSHCMLFREGDRDGYCDVAPSTEFWEPRRVVLTDRDGNCRGNGKDGFRIGFNPFATKVTFWIRNLRLFKARAAQF